MPGLCGDGMGPVLVDVFCGDEEVVMLDVATGNCCHESGIGRVAQALGEKFDVLERMCVLDGGSSDVHGGCVESVETIWVA